MINIIKIKSNEDYKLIQEFKYILEHFTEFCSNVKKQKMVNVVNQPKSFLKSQSPLNDIIGDISNTTLKKIYNCDSNNPYNKLEKYLFFYEYGFIIVNLSPEKIIDNPKLSSYDNMKYSTVNEGYKSNNYGLVWIELICIRKEKRGKGCFDLLISEIEIEIKKKYKDKDFFVIGLDISGTDNGWMNADLREYYMKKGFDFNLNELGIPLDSFYTYTGGAQIAVKEIDI